MLRGYISRSRWRVGQVRLQKETLLQHILHHVHCGSISCIIHMAAAAAVARGAWLNSHCDEGQSCLRPPNSDAGPPTPGAACGRERGPTAPEALRPIPGNDRAVGAPRIRVGACPSAAHGVGWWGRLAWQVACAARIVVALPPPTGGGEGWTPLRDRQTGGAQTDPARRRGSCRGERLE